jgi:cell division protein FtsQ
MKKIMSIGFVVLFSLAVLWLAAYGFSQYRNQHVGKIVVHIQRRGTKGFLNVKKIADLVRRTENPAGRQIKDFHPAKVEKVLAENPYVEAADVYLNISGDVMVNIRERTPLMRIFNEQNRSCYVDENGTLFPVSREFTPRVLPANGYIRTPLTTGENIFQKKYRHTMLPALFLLAKKIAADDFLRADISQLFVNSKGNIDLVPELGRYVIHFGDTTAMNVKLENLEAFNRQVFARGGWSKYKSINLAFINQIVCTKKQTYGRK